MMRRLAKALVVIGRARKEVRDVDALLCDTVGGERL